LRKNKPSSTYRGQQTINCFDLLYILQRLTPKHTNVEHSESALSNAHPHKLRL
jgi:thiamine phosphate synthase YjbQ (UPF0047 family)